MKPRGVSRQTMKLVKIRAGVETGLETGDLGLRATSEEPHDTEGPPRDVTARHVGRQVLAVGIVDRCGSGTGGSTTLGSFRGFWITRCMGRVTEP